MIVCADDFGLTEDVNRAVLHLLEKGRLSAVSCMVALKPFDLIAFSHLLNYRDQVDVGLHLTLTDVPPVHDPSGIQSLLDASSQFHSMRALLRRGWRGALNPDEVAREVRCQYERFIQYAGSPPDYLDSHLHVHQFPGVRDGVLRFLDSLGSQDRPYVRNSAISFKKAVQQGVSPLKCLAIGMAGYRFRMALETRRWPTNDGFAGVYAYEGHRAYPGYLARFVTCMESRTGILMTHPGEAEPWREVEYRTLLDAECLTGKINRFGPASRPEILSAASP